ncbi:leucyl aminopeptidase [Chryseobacterium sp. Leaf404]|uniref:M28 family metallopeptidase n=1 Tax=unclassified Chryseobacterium TaxID=2593645 RepID=UPI0006FC5757|nr:MULTISPECIES: M20/M25/M40 family metallo-hydrolase [unclassified Chryseobacterium]KQT18050.1 leucyl aminopeptidase [Chryseobacterium sp. Leaf404]
MIKKIHSLVLLSFAAAGFQAQNAVPAYQTRVDMISEKNIVANLKEFEGLGIKTTGSKENENAFNWIKSKYISYGFTEDQISEDPFKTGKAESKNLIITKIGTVHPDKYIIICGHFDSINGPGVNDNGSGTAIIMEAARILRDVPTDYSIKFIHFSGEEQGLKGSRHYVDHVVYKDNVRQFDIKLVFNLDQVGGKKGLFHDTVYCDEDQGGTSKNNKASTEATHNLQKYVALYSPLKTALDPAEDTDYISFERKGEVITGFFEYLRSELPHTPDDTFANTDTRYVFNIGKATLGALQHFAEASKVDKDKK